MAKPIGEITLKGKTIDEHSQLEEGRGLLRWLVDQPIKEDDFKGWTIGRNKYIKEKLALYKTDPEVTEKQLKEPPKKANSDQLQVIIRLLEQIEQNQRKLMGKDGIVWDE